MFEIKALKKEARGTLRRNYFIIVLTCFFIMIVMGTFHNPVEIIEDSIMPYFKAEEEQLEKDVPLLAETSRLSARNSSDIIEEFLENAGAGNTTAEHWTNGVLSVFATATEGTGNLAIGILNVINEFALGNRVSNGVIILIGLVITALIYLLVVVVMFVGFHRFMLESRRYSKTQPIRILFPWTIRRGFHIAWVMFVKRVYIILWMFTVAGGFIKHYSYKLVPMILSENPDMSANEAITLSRKMMDGYKWRAFLLDLSFAGWWVLSMLTLSLFDVFYLRPYRYATYTELYMFLREKAKENKIPSSEKLCDSLLDAKITDGVYPAQDYLITPSPARKWIQSDYKRDYSVTSLILMFFSFAFIGWLWEVLLFLFAEGTFINRGTSYGPWLPIYGFGGLVILVLLKRFRDKPPLLFIVTMISCGIMEYVTAWALETFKGMKYWDYTGYFLNIQGRVCLEGLLVFAIAGLAATYLIAPALDDLFKKIPMKYKKIICAVLIAAFVTDQVYSFFVPNTGKGITEYD